jgi:hypothetical protein
MAFHPVTVVQETADKLGRFRWVFVLTGDYLLLERFYYEERAKVTEEYQVAQFYDRGDPDGGYGTWEWLKESDVPWNDNLKAEALAALVRPFTVVREGELPKPV